MRRVRIAAALLALTATAACGTVEGGTPAPLQGHLYVVGIDISASRTPTQLRQGQELISGLIARMNFGDRLVLVQTFRAGNDSTGQWSDSIPSLREVATVTGRDRERLEDFQSIATAMSAVFFDVNRQRRAPTTDLFYTLGRAADYIRAAGGRPATVVLMSDMLQSTPEVDMEQPGGVPGHGWIAQRAEQRRLPNLSGACVVIAGAEVASTRAANVRRFWEDYFRSTGARLPVENYRTLISDPSEIRC